MFARRARHRWWTLPLVVCAFAGPPASARAASGIYLQLGLGFGEWTGEELVTREQPGTGDIPSVGSGCCPGGTFSGQFRAGFSFLGVVAPEFVGFGSGWNLGDSDPAGGGFIGGGIRVFPLGILELAQLVNLEGFPIDVGVGASAAYALAGSNDFAYEGWALGFDIAVEYIVASFFSVGLKTDFWFPNYDPFVVTSSNTDQGRCLDGGAQQVFDDEIGPGGVIDRSNRGNLCPAGGRGPSTTVISPQIVMTFRFDVFN